MDRVRIQAPHFKGFAMIDLQYEMRKSQNYHAKVTMIKSIVCQFFLNQSLGIQVTKFKKYKSWHPEAQ